jgi:hypothetical protein
LRSFAASSSSNFSYLLKQPLKGSGGNMGARVVQKLSLTLEQKGRAGTVEGAAELLPQLEHEYERAKVVFETERLKA